ncbi:MULTISPECIES: hypothetical protein [Planktothricoides]|uniref:Uncharacterized protein n=1 Tax=Planktothricoides raciborskii FACHB-1370 TaxID=2949576 RepID=A0ABR8E9C6_9CYAN|nr:MULTISPECIES: hypothetical protein [Planktothricoides]MBD2543439.1 hypothetical protein [Planktothricoides raciborskii FACHB-1370]MBD2581738.1 hypothetical protein [Planktothricoides raciborskii FACHB-1261]
MRESTDLLRERNLRNRVSMGLFRFQQGLLQETRFLCFLIVLQEAYS